jgi:flagellar hook protein FlgE
MNFTNFASAGLAALDMTKRGQISLTIPNNQGITIGGNAPGDVGLQAGTRCGIFQDNSDLMRVSFNPGTGAATPQAIDISLGLSTQFASPFSITALTQDGYATGRLTGVEVDPSGIITARFGNGKSQQLGQVALANFRNPGGLQSQGDTSWCETYSSGVALLGAPGTSDLGLIQSGALEDSNVQLTNELVALIIAQRNFQASAQTIRSADAVTQTIINIR